MHVRLVTLGSFAVLPNQSIAVYMLALQKALISNRNYVKVHIHICKYVWNSYMKRNLPGINICKLNCDWLHHLQLIHVFSVHSIGYLPLSNQIWEFESHHTLYNNAAITPQYTVEEQYRSLPWEAGTRGASAQRNSDGKL